MLRIELKKNYSHNNYAFCKLCNLMMMNVRGLKIHYTRVHNTKLLLVDNYPTFEIILTNKQEEYWRPWI
ncbi:hypothetical protein AMVITR09b [Betaentomopoxvirus amoorei]|uniref:AMVITR09 n=1 Tax=Amsacta moorei entomopoxvirus TaxID=28321 RepID=Q9DGZ2_AMEPV|nr:hypothetical protein AMVITR09a [Amsacta moorei entomopoxvirus]NP_065053.1 hypothetical protein AMVITR09b [Amsacta moorei entomopoxvirus]AAG02981.1 AMVITR09 [Amsacta moorei entomopoxvirus]AAG02995.1 AMVITR09 [Amsacta moorei entomopoxvirus]